MAYQGSESGLEIGFELDRRWRWMRGEMDGSKKPDLLLLATIFAEAEIPYALIGGLALQVYQAEPRTTLDIDLAVLSYDDLPVTKLAQAGFSKIARHEHSENWKGPQGTPIQFSADPLFKSGISSAQVIELDGVMLRIVSEIELLRAKLRAAADSSRRRSKQLQDLADIVSLLERDSTLENNLSLEERALLRRLTTH